MHLPHVTLRQPPGAPLGVLLGCALLAGGCEQSCAGSLRGAARVGSSASPQPPIHLTHGVSVGEVGPRGAVIWARGSQRGSLRVEVRGPGGNTHTYAAPFLPARDLTARVVLHDLSPGKLHEYRAWASLGRETTPPPDAVPGRFVTAPSAADAAPVKFAWGGDLAGQNVCRDAARGYPALDAVADASPAFFVALGDMIYADGTCDSVGAFGNRQLAGDFPRATRLEHFWAHWRYNRADPAHQRLLAEAGYYSVWDDHEVVNDFGPTDDRREDPPYNPKVKLMPLGRQAFVDWGSFGPETAADFRFYRSVRWGKHLELVMLDTRQYRDAKLEEDRPERPKTLLGAQQLAWLERTLHASDATWKIIASSVPLSIPTGWPPEGGRDGWASFGGKTGYRQELTRVFQLVGGARPRNTLFITTDVHFAAGFRYRPLPEDLSFVVHELVSGPLSAGLYPNREFDASFGAERLFLHGADPMPTSFEGALPWLNFGSIEIDSDGTLTARIVDATGHTQHTMRLSPEDSRSDAGADAAVPHSAERPQAD